MRKSHLIEIKIIRSKIIGGTETDEEVVRFDRLLQREFNADLRRAENPNERAGKAEWARHAIKKFLGAGETEGFLAVNRPHPPDVTQVDGL